MKTNLTRPTTFFILGIPRSGTTILANILNSLEDGFCLGEPHWFEESGQTGPGAFGKMAEYYVPPEDRGDKTLIDACIRPALFAGTSWKLGGYKETWHRGNRKQAEPRLAEHTDLVDFFLVIFRHPVPTLASMRALSDLGEAGTWDRAQPTHLNRDYRTLDFAAQHPRGIGLVFEHLVGNPLLYLNRKLPFRIDGPLELQPTGHTYGDPRANRSDRIEVQNRDTTGIAGTTADLQPAIEIWNRWANR